MQLYVLTNLWSCILNQKNNSEKQFLKNSTDYFVCLFVQLGWDGWIQI